ncbi:hypothetical protein PYW08_012510 [Mythimna loreyi]|uniref:Uncharacterized protein n=1 Tax=Mythimna loreyi TaxID=667449 RepID=A0ACC2Q0G9_9NEOP|nr:hypothetical protein PYW08_012510 [Mythimna loreyi]
MKKELLDLPPGSNCTWDGVDGVCKTVYDCASAMEDIKKKNYPPICSFEGVKPIICCADCVPGNFVNLDADVDLSYYRTGEKSRDKCLEYFKTLPYPCEGSPEFQVFKHKHREMNCYAIQVSFSVITGGRNAYRDQFPHMALLGYGNDMKTAQWLCGGSVISDKFILTAGHCISSPSVGPVKYIALGILKRTDPPELWQKHNVKRIIPHPEYQPPSKYNDIALLETENTISFNVHVLPACLHLNEESDPVADATGWGALGHRKELAEILQTVTLEKFEDAECQQVYPVGT